MSGKVTPFLILARSRTGSNLLVSLLDSHPRVQARGERLRRDDGRDWNTRIREALEPADGAVQAAGFKMFYYHPIGADGAPAWRRLQAIPDLRVIHLRRRNLLRAIVSREIAAHSGVWQNEGELEPVPLADKRVLIEPDALAAALASSRRMEEEAQRRFAAHPVIEVTFEDLVSDRDGTFRCITDFLGVHTWCPSTPLRRQNPEPLSALVRNYAALKSAFADTAWACHFE